MYQASIVQRHFADRRIRAEIGPLLPALHRGLGEAGSDEGDLGVALDVRAVGRSGHRDAVLRIVRSLGRVQYDLVECQFIQIAGADENEFGEVRGGGIGEFECAAGSLIPTLACKRPVPINVARDRKALHPAAVANGGLRGVDCFGRPILVFGHLVAGHPRPLRPPVGLGPGRLKEVAVAVVVEQHEADALRMVRRAPAPADVQGHREIPGVFDLIERLGQCAVGLVCREPRYRAGIILVRGIGEDVPCPIRFPAQLLKIAFGEIRVHQRIRPAKALGKDQGQKPRPHRPRRVHGYL
jgi:hypothetical protein